jgi:two-component system, NtrC family, sensor histidine kinase PilS
MAQAIEVGALARAAEEVDLPWRVISLINIFRLLAPMVLLLVFFFNAPNYTIGWRFPGMFLGVCAAWFSVGLVSIRSIQQRWPSAQWHAIILLVVDTVAVAVLIHASGGMSSGLANLLVLPSGASATIIKPRLALAATAFIVIALLFQALVAALSGFGSASDFVVAGLTGASLFAITLLALPLANRLRESEARVQQRDLDLANLSELNEFIVQHLRESILVVDAEDRIRLINETASLLLKGENVLNGELLGEVSPRLLYLLETWRRQEYDRRDTIAEVVSADGGTVIQPQFVSLSQHGPGPVLIFLEDTSQLAERVQQSKLAALGRLSASIAHEIRNPVGAMSHASQLLRESPGIGSDDRHLTDIIEKNAVRVSQIIDNVLELSRRDTTRQERLQLDSWLETLANEFRDTLQLAPERLRLTSDPTRLQVHFDPSHLHQVVWNLCDNAVKHGGGDHGDTVELRAGRVPTSGRPYLEVADRGPGIDAADAERIFEPFFTNGVGGTGLGLFISRELCQTNGAMLLYEPRPGGGSTFRVIFADPQRWEW